MRESMNMARWSLKDEIGIVISSEEGGHPIAWGDPFWNTGIAIQHWDAHQLMIEGGPNNYLWIQADCPVSTDYGDPQTLILLELRVNGHCIAHDGGHMRLGETIFLHAAGCLPIPAPQNTVQVRLHLTDSIKSLRGRISGASLWMRREAYCTEN